MKQRPQVGVLDCNNFFVSCERLFRPDLQHKPVVVLSSNDGCVVARSQEVKDMNIPMGVPYFKIKDILDKQKVTVFSSQFALYRDISRRVFEVLRSELETVEQYSVDEAFFLLSEGNAVAERMLALKDKVEHCVGIPVSIGVGFSKTQAKAAVDRAKHERGVCIWSDDTWTQQAATLPLAQIWGVGAQLELRYKQHGLVTVSDLLAADASRIEQLFGIAGTRMQQELSGRLVYELGVSPSRQHSVMSSRSFKSSTKSYEVVADALAYHVRHVAETLRRMDVGTTELRVSIRTSRHGDFILQGGAASAILPVTTNDTFVLLQAATGLCQQLFKADVPYKKVGVVALGLQPNPDKQQSLFHDVADNRILLDVVDTINTKRGRELVTIGNRLRSHEWSSRLDAKSPAYTTKWSDLAQVNAK